MEVIVTIIATAILGVIFINFMGTAMSKSTRAVEMVQGEALAEAILERIIADYIFKINQNSSTALGLIKTDIDYLSKSTAPMYRQTISHSTPQPVCRPLRIIECSKNDTSGLNRTLKVTVAASGNDLTILLTPSRDANSPPVAF